MSSVSLVQLQSTRTVVPNNGKAWNIDIIENVAK